MAPVVRWFSRLFRNRRVVRYGLVMCNVLLLVAIGLFTLRGSGAQDVLTRSVLTASETNPIDQLSSAEIAANAAQAVDLYYTTSVRNNADSVNIEMAITPADSLAVAKPQAVAASAKSRADIIEYTVKEGENVASIAAKFNVTSDTIIWSNNLRGSNVAAGTKLIIPPINGLLYTVQSGDTPQSLASKYRTSQEQIVAFNDIELTGLKPGERIVIPNAQRPVQVFARFGSTPGRAVYGYNGYDYGFCTWYAADRRAQIGRPVPANLGDAWTWDDRAAAMGFTVNKTPAAGAVVVTATSRRPGHVAFVERVNSDGSVLLSEMNSPGWGRVSEELIPASQANSYNYIH